MNYYSAMQRRSDNRWEYTCNSRATGYCKEYSDPDTWQSVRKYMSDEEVEQIRSFKEKYHNHAHETEKEACDCYKEYMLDHRLKLGMKDNNTQRKCENCKEWTQCMAGVGFYRMWNLCEKCQTREIISELYSVGESWES